MNISHMSGLLLGGLLIQATVGVAKPHALSLCTITFDKFEALPSRLDGESMACLDAVALTAQRDSAVKLVLVGNATTLEMTKRETGYDPSLPMHRVVNTRIYLGQEKGIDMSRIEARTGRSGSSTVESYLLPQGANFDADVPRTTLVPALTK
jgi:hypothetical protein